jgi:tetratricopeptide (TPR) repeat protein
MRRWICVLVVIISVRSALLVGAETSPLDGIDQLIARGHYAEARARSDSADRLARTTGNTALAAEAELARGTIWQSRGFAQPAVQHFARALDLAEQTANRQLVARVYGALAAAHADLGHWDRVLDYAERQREADDRHTPSAEFQYLFQRGVAFEEVHDATQARTALDAALATATTVGDPRLISMATGELAAVVLDADRDRPRAIAMYEEALDIAQRARLPDLQATWLLDPSPSSAPAAHAG